MLNIKCYSQCSVWSIFSLEWQPNTHWGRAEHWTGLGLDWIRTMTNLLILDWIRTVKCFINLGSGPDSDWVNGKKFCVFFNESCILLISWTLFGLGFWIFYTFWTKVGLGLSHKTGLDLDRKIWQSAHLWHEVETWEIDERNWKIIYESNLFST